MAHSKKGEKDTEEHQVPTAEKHSDDDHHPHANARDGAMQGPGDGAQHVAAVELSYRQEVEPGGEHADPTGHEHGVETHRRLRSTSGEEMVIEKLQEQARREED